MSKNRCWVWLLLALGGCATGAEPVGTAVAPQSADVVSAQSGEWGSPQTWSTGAVPQAGQVVRIESGHEVTVTGDQQAASIDVAGTLAFSRSSDATLMLQGSLVVRAGGTLDMGAPTDPIPTDVRAQLIFDASTSANQGGTDFNLSDTGLWVLAGGRWSSHGARVGRTWSELVEDAGSGASAVVVAGDMSDWPIGGEILIPSTGRDSRTPQGSNEFESEDELRHITAVTAESGQTRIELDSPLSHAHEGSGLATGEVALMERNVTVRAINGRAHTTFLYGSRGSLYFTSLEHLGPRGVDHRHPIHLERTVESSVGMVFHGNVIRDSDNGALVMHGALGTRVAENIAFRVLGSAFRAEPGAGSGEQPSSMGNAFVRNMVVKLTTADRFGRRTYGFSVSSANRYLGNVTASMAGSGDTSGYHWGEFGHRGLPWVFVGNESHSNRIHGAFGWWNLGFGDLVGFKTWRNGASGVHWGAYINPLRFHGLVSFGNEDSNFQIKSAKPWIQDSVLQGEADYPTRYGAYIVKYTLPPSAEDPGRIIRSTFRNHSIADIDHIQQVTCNADDPGCTPTFTAIQHTQLESSLPIRFGNDWKRIDTFFDVQGWTGNPYNLSADFRMTRSDQPKPSSSATHQTDMDAWVDPEHPQPKQWQLPPTVEWVQAPTELGDQPITFEAKATGFTGELGSVEILVDGFNQGAPWKAELYTNTGLSGSPLTTLELPGAELHSRYESILPGVLEFGNWSARLTRTAHFAAGDYEMRYLANDGIRVIVDGTTVVDDWRTRPTCCSAEGAVPVSLEGGRHTIVVEYFNGDGTYPHLKVDLLRKLSGGAATASFTLDPDAWPYPYAMVYARATDDASGLNAYSSIIDLAGDDRCIPLSCGSSSCGEVADGCGGMLDCGDCATLDTPQLLFSETADRSAPAPLDGATVQGRMFVFVRGKDIETASFFFNGASSPYSTDRDPPFDLEDTASDGSAVPFDLTTLTEGPHELTAVIGRSDGSMDALVANFKVLPGPYQHGGGTEAVAGDGGCNCRVASDSQPWNVPIGMWLMAWLLLRRRLHRRRSVAPERKS